MRYFVNKFADYPSGNLPVHVDTARWTQYIAETVDRIRSRMPPSVENCDGGLYVGCAGIAYACYHLAMSEPLSASRDRLLAMAVEYVEVALNYGGNRRTRDPPAAFLLGPGGVLVVGSLIYDSVGRVQDALALRQRYAGLASLASKRGDYLGVGSDELFVGRAGYLCGALILNANHKPEAIPASLLTPVCAAIVESGRQYARLHQSPCPLMFDYHGTEYLGAAHGLSAILQMLLSCREFMQSDQSAAKDIRTSVDYMLTLMQPNGNIPPAMDEIGGRGGRDDSNELVHWCHGAPGIIYLFAKAHLLWPNDGRYLSACERFAELTWRQGLLKKGPGICHGVAGSGYVFLIMYRLTGELRYLHRANKFAEFLQDPEFLKVARTPDCPWSLYEGLAGTVCYLVDLMQPQKAEFPLFNIFV